MKKVCIVGLGYIGLPTAIVAAQHGFEVVGYDVNVERVYRINQCDPVIQEPEIFDKLSEVLQAGNFKAVATIEAADYFVIAVPTPFKEEKKADLSYVWAAGKTLAAVLQKGNVVILESTIPVGTTEQFSVLLETKTGLKAGVDFFVAHCPERVLPGKIFHELVHNARIIGGINRESVDAAKSFYKKFVKGQLYLTNATAAEMVKLVENSSRDVAIAFANQVASMAYAVGLNPYEVIELANKHPRVSILNPSCGVGGHCIAVDPWFLVETFPAQTALLKTAREVNDEKPIQVIGFVRSAVREWQVNYGRNPRVLTLGVTYKPNVDDLRESPALMITKQLANYRDIDLLVCEPNVPQQELRELFGKSVVSFEQGLLDADIIVCLVKHDQFSSLVELQKQSTKNILDFCGLLYSVREETAEQEKLFWSARSAVVECYEEPMPLSNKSEHIHKENF